MCIHTSTSYVKPVFLLILGGAWVLCFEIVESRHRFEKHVFTYVAYVFT